MISLIGNLRDRKKMYLDRSPSPDKKLNLWVLQQVTGDSKSFASG